tara:strand:+ start:200 stop:370 length:171 start_codon:yes stop_codon:yes gene_type:complete
MNKEQIQDRLLELEKQAIDNFLEYHLADNGRDTIIEGYLDEDEKEEYYQLEKELYS